MPLVIRHLRRWAASTPRLVDAALCRAMAWRLAHHASRQPVTIVHRTTADLGALELHELTPEQVLNELRRIGWGELR